MPKVSINREYKVLGLDFCGVEVWRGGLGGAYRLPTLSSAGASLAPPCVRFDTPLIEPDVWNDRIRLSEKGSRGRPRETTGTKLETVDTAKEHLQLTGTPLLGTKRLAREGNKLVRARQNIPCGVVAVALALPQRQRALRAPRCHGFFPSVYPSKIC